MPTLSQSRPGREPIRYLYTVALPVTSASLVGALWFLVWGIREGSMPAMLAGLPGHWLPVLLGVRGTSFVLTQIIGVIPVMAAVGLLQDYLRVRPVWAWAYLPGFAIAPAF